MGWKKRFGIAAVGLLALVGAFYGFISLRSSSLLATRLDVTAEVPELPSDPNRIARGERLARSVFDCAHCHADDFGGALVVDDGALGRLAGPNITAGNGGTTASYTAVDWVRAIRHGLAPDGRVLVLMPADSYAPMKQDDMADLVAFLQTVPPVDRDSIPITWGPVGKMLVAFGPQTPPALRMSPGATTPSEVAVGETVEYGAYLAKVAGCTGCHKANLAGGEIAPGLPLASNLTRLGKIATWSEAQFFTAMRTGKTPDGGKLDPFMPSARAYVGLTDTELRALWVFLQTVPAATPD